MVVAGQAVESRCGSAESAPVGVQVHHVYVLPCKGCREESPPVQVVGIMKK